MEERRKHKRLDLEVMVELERLDEESVTTLKYVHVEVTDISRSGLGFKSKADLEDWELLRYKDSDLDERSCGCCY